MKGISARRRHSILMSIVLAAVAITATAAEDPDIGRFDDPSAKSETSGSTNRIVLEAGDADGKATARIAKVFHLKKDDANVPLDKRVLELIPRLALTVTAPFDSKKADKVDVGSLSGLTAGTNASLDFSLLLWPQASLNQKKALPAICDRLMPSLIPGYTWSDVSKLALSCDKRLFAKEKLEEVVKALKSRKEECKKCSDASAKEPSRCALLTEAALACDTANGNPASIASCALVRSEKPQACAECQKNPLLCEAIKDKPEPALVADFATLLAAEKAGIIAAEHTAFPGQNGVNVSLKANRQKFEYVLEETPTESKNADEEGFGVSVAYSYLGERSLWAAGYSHEYSYKGADKSLVCSPIGTTGSTNCKEVSIGAPKRETAELAFIENRRLIAAGTFAIAPRFEYDFKKSDWGLSVPLYFLTNPKVADALTGGITVGYAESDDKDKDGFGATVFVSKAFTFF